MSWLRKHVGFVRLVATVAASTSVGACMGWHTQPVSATRLGMIGPQRLRVTLNTGEELFLENATFAGDTIIGSWSRRNPVQGAVMVKGGQRVPLPSATIIPTSAGRLSVPLSAVREIAVWGEDTGRTVLLVSGLVVLGALVAAVAAAEASLSHF